MIANFHSMYCMYDFIILSHSHWELVGAGGGGRVVVKNRESPDFLSPEVGTSVKLRVTLQFYFLSFSRNYSY